MKRGIFYLICLLYYPSIVLGQVKMDSSVIDTIRIEQTTIILKVPYVSSKYRNTLNYEEGIFMDYPFTKNSLLFIHKGALVEKPFFRKLSNYELREKIKNENMISYRGMSGNKNYFREDYYFNYGISIVCQNISNEYILFFDYIMDDVRISFSTDRKSIYNGYNMNNILKNYYNK